MRVANIKYGILFIIVIVIFAGCSKTINTSNSTSVNRQIDAALDAAVGKAVKNYGENAYAKGELATEGHEILEVEEKDSTVKAYTISRFGYFGFQNGVFTTISGNGAIPTVITFSKNNSGYSLMEYKEPQDGSAYGESIKKMFPKSLWDKVLSHDDSVDSKLTAQQVAQAAQYLKSIGKTSKVDSIQGEKKLPNINVTASNKLFSDITKDDLFLNNFPYWLGTQEKLENGQRYIYETSQSKTSDGYDMISFKKTTADGKVVAQRNYKIIGKEPVLQ